MADLGGFWSQASAGDGVFESRAVDGKSRFVAHYGLADTHAVLIVMRERADVLGPANRQTLIAFGKMTLVGLFCFMAVWLGGEWLVLGPLEDLTRSSRRLGAGHLDTRVALEGLAPELRQLGETFNAMAAQLAAQNAELRQANARLSELATIDSLTGLANRRRFDEQVEAEWSRAKRERKSVALLLLDVDHFKRFNDRYGHTEGDSCLRGVAGVLHTAARRPGDLAARVGGEEFALILPTAHVADADLIAEGVRSQIEALDIEHLDSTERRVTISIGVAALKPQANETVRSLLDAADSALYRAKREGRNRVVRYEPPIALVS